MTWPEAGSQPMRPKLELTHTRWQEKENAASQQNAAFSLTNR